MIFLLQPIIFCAVFTLMVKLSVRDNPLNGLYFYPEPVQEKVYELGLTDRKTVAKKKNRIHDILLYCYACIAYSHNRIMERYFGFLDGLRSVFDIA